MRSRFAGQNLNSLVVLDELYRTRSVARTAEALGLTPSAVSHTLGRLRRMYGDELFVRTADGLVPTERALMLADDLRAGLSRLESAIRPVGPLDPASLRRSFALSTTDFGAWRVLPVLGRTLRERAPAVDLVVRSLPSDPVDALESGEIDAMVAVFGHDTPGLYRRALFTERHRVMVRRGHPALVDGTLSLEAYLAGDHLSISPRGRPGSPIDHHLREIGRHRRVTMRIPEFLLGPLLVAETDLILTAPERLLESFAALLPVVLVAPPFELRTFDVSLFWHARSHDDPAHRWFRELLIDAHRSAYGDRGSAPGTSSPA